MNENKYTKNWKHVMCVRLWEAWHGVACMTFVLRKIKNCSSSYFEIFSLRFGGIIITHSLTHTRNYGLCWFEGNMNLHMSSQIQMTIYVRRSIGSWAFRIDFMCDFSARQNAEYSTNFGFTCLSVRQLIAECRCWRTSRMRIRSSDHLFFITSVLHIWHVKRLSALSSGTRSAPIYRYI